MDHGVESMSSAELWAHFERAARRARWLRAAATVGLVLAIAAILVLCATVLREALDGPTWARSLRPR